MDVLRLRMVAAFVPTNDPDAYLRGFRDNAQECFAATLYDDVGPGEVDGFNFGPDDGPAPHSPSPILFSNDLVGLNHTAEPDWHNYQVITAAYQEFLATATDLIIEERT